MGDEERKTTKKMKAGGRGNQENWYESTGRFESIKMERTEINCKSFKPSTSISRVIPDLKSDLPLIIN